MEPSRRLLSSFIPSVDHAAYDWADLNGQFASHRQITPGRSAPLAYFRPSWPQLRKSYRLRLIGFHLAALAAMILTPSHARDEETSYSAVIEAIRRSDYLDVEKVFLERLLDTQPDTRLAHGSDIVENIDMVLSRMDQPRSLDEQSYLALVVSLGPGRPVTTALCEEDDTIVAFDEEAQRLLIESDLTQPSIVSLPAGGHVLSGIRFQYWLDEFAPLNQQPSGDWNLAYCGGRAELGFGEDSVRAQLRQVPIKVYNVRDAIKRRDQISRRAVSWKPFLPARDDSRGTRTARICYTIFARHESSGNSLLRCGNL